MCGVTAGPAGSDIRMSALTRSVLQWFSATRAHTAQPGRLRVHTLCCRRAFSVASAPTVGSVVFASEILPHPSKAKTGGEDAVFVDQTTLSFGVADGVGGWAEHGIDSSAYSRELMRQAAAACARVGVVGAVNADSAKAILQMAWEATTVRGGSATAFVGFFSGSTLYTANLGDSGCIVLRPGHTGAYSVVRISPFRAHVFSRERESDLCSLLF
jgi:hypothetical protein